MIFDGDTYALMYGTACSHEGIGQPGCVTCDPDRRRVAERAQFTEWKAWVEITDDLRARVAQLEGAIKTFVERYPWRNSFELAPIESALDSSTTAAWLAEHDAKVRRAALEEFMYPCGVVDQNDVHASACSCCQWRFLRANRALAANTRAAKRMKKGTR